MRFRYIAFLMCAALAAVAADAVKPLEKTVVRSFEMKNKSDFFGWGGEQRYVRTRVSCGEGVGKVEVLETKGDEDRRYQLGAICDMTFLKGVKYRITATLKANQDVKKCSVIFQLNGPPYTIFASKNVDLKANEPLAVELVCTPEKEIAKPTRILSCHVKLDQGCVFEVSDVKVEFPESALANEADHRAVPKTFHLSPMGSDDAPGTAEKPWKTIARANKEVVPGDTVQFQPGKYVGPIAPARSGRPGKPITYLGGEGVQLTGSASGWCIELNDREYITIDGFTAIDIGPCRWLSVRKGRHCIFRNLVFSGSRSWCPVQCNGIEYCLFDNILAERTLSTGQNGLVSGDMWNNRDAFHNVFQNIRVSRAGHRPFGIMEGSSDNVVRDSVFDGRYGRNFEMFFPARTLMERCTLTNAYNGAGSADPRAKWFVSDSIFRYNVITRNNGMPLVANSYYDTWHKLQLGITNSRMYNNTFYMNDCGAWDIGEDRGRKDKDHYYIDGNICCNNIFFDNDRAGAGVSIQLATSLKPDGNLFRRNIIAGDKPGRTVVRYGLIPDKNKPYGLWQPNLLTLAEAEKQLPGMFRENLDADPKFVNGQDGDLRLADGSPAVDAGDFLARATADGKGSVIPVSDAAMFYDGYGIPWEKGDLVMIGTDRREARVVKTDRAKNELTLDREVAFRKGDPVTLAYAGKAPDLGAYETGLTVSSGPAKLPDHHRQPGLDRPHGKPVIDCDFEVEDAEKWFFWCKVNRSYHSWGWVERRDDGQGRCMTSVGTPMTGMEINYKGFRIDVVQESRKEDKPVEGDMRIQIEPPQWELDVYPYLEFDYRLKPGTPWGVALDAFPAKDLKYRRVYLGGTADLVTGPAPNLKKFTMIADGQWHHLRVDVRAIREALPELRRAARLSFRCGNEKYLDRGSASSQAQAWLDNVKILEK